jgi:hypothetical protein
MMAISSEALGRAGIRLSPAAFLALVEQVVEEAGRQRQPLPPPDALPAAEEAALRRAGLRGEAPKAGRDGLAVLAARFATVLASSLSVAEAARHLGVDRSRIRQRLKERTLYGFKHCGEWVLPRFQFDEVGMVPGIERVVPGLDPALHPVEAEAWFTQPSASLEIDEQPVSPREWLRAGHDPSAVAEIAAALVG